MPTNRISGKVQHKESGLGVADLLVVIFDLDPGTRSEDAPAVLLHGVAGDAPVLPQDADRLGSVLTDANGRFELAYEDQEFQIRQPPEVRPDLLLVVMVPEEPGADVARQVLFTSSYVRQNAGRTEQYLIRLSSDQLTKAGITLPTTALNDVESPALRNGRLRAIADRTEELLEGERTALSVRVNHAQAMRERYRIEVEPELRKHLAGASPTPSLPTGVTTRVEPGGSVAGKNAEVIGDGVKRHINGDLIPAVVNGDDSARPKISGYVALTDTQRERVAQALAPDKTIAAEQLDEILAAEGGQPPQLTTLVRENPILQFCRERSHKESAAMVALGLPGGAESGAGASSGSTSSTTTSSSSAAPLTPVSSTPATPPVLQDQDIFRFMSRLMETMTSPEEKVLTGLEVRADQGLIEDDIQALAFGPSPADVPAFYDFHHLQIAFEDVWQEATDEGILALGKDVYQQIVELGGDPHRPGIIVDPIFKLLQEGRTVLSAHDTIRTRADRVTTTASRRTVRDHRRGGGGGPEIRDHRTGSSRGTWTPSSTPPPPPPPPPPSTDHALNRLPALLDELERRAKENYTFTVYAASAKERSINFALLVTYRQCWEPMGYQAGRLVKTLTLAPKETQRYSKKRVTHRKRMEREVATHLRSTREEISQTTRAEQEIVRKATSKTNFSLTSENSVKVPVAEGVTNGTTKTTSFSREAAKESNEVKKAFHEAVFKSAQEYKDENTTEVSTEESEEFEVIESGEVTNPNDELALTCLFYELQRRYRVTEKIHRLTPVVLVAQEVPRPDEIDDAWLIAHDWILRRVLLDDSFGAALTYLSQNIVGDQVALDELRLNVDQQRRVVDELRMELAVARERLQTYRQLSERSLLNRATPSGGGGGGFLSSIPIVGDIAEEVVDVVEDVAGEVGDFLFSDGGSPTGQDAMKDSLERAAEDERNLLFRIEREITALNALTETYSKGLADHYNHRAQIDRLRIHVKQNILHYMQAIWSYEPPDQRYFRLHQTRVPTLEARRRRIRFSDLAPLTDSLVAMAHRRIPTDIAPARDLFPIDAITELAPELEFTTLARVADLDTLLGFKGNYLMFPLKQPNKLTDYMAQPYVVAGFNELVDPDDLGNWTLDEFSDYVVCLKEQLSADEFDHLRDQLQTQFERLLTSPRPNGDEIIVPTQSLFIEALPARHSLIEEFKARHRAVDVKKAQAEARYLEIENVRLAARILAGEHGDPKVDKKIVVHDHNPSIVVSPTDN